MGASQEEDLPLASQVQPTPILPHLSLLKPDTSPPSQYLLLTTLSPPSSHLTPPPSFSLLSLQYFPPAPLPRPSSSAAPLPPQQSEAVDGPLVRRTLVICGGLKMVQDSDSDDDDEEQEGGGGTVVQSHSDKASEQNTSPKGGTLAHSPHGGAPIAPSSNSPPLPTPQANANANAPPLPSLLSTPHPPSRPSPALMGTGGSLSSLTGPSMPDDSPFDTHPKPPPPSQPKPPIETPGAVGKTLFASPPPVPIAKAGEAEAREEEGEKRCEVCGGREGEGGRGALLTCQGWCKVITHQHI